MFPFSVKGQRVLTRISVSHCELSLSFLVKHQTILSKSQFSWLTTYQGSHCHFDVFTITLNISCKCNAYWFLLPLSNIILSLWNIREVLDSYHTLKFACFCPTNSPKTLKKSRVIEQQQILKAVLTLISILHFFTFHLLFRWGIRFWPYRVSWTYFLLLFCEWTTVCNYLGRAFSVACSVSSTPTADTQRHTLSDVHRHMFTSTQVDADSPRLQLRTHECMLLHSCTHAHT